MRWSLDSFFPPNASNYHRDHLRNCKRDGECEALEGQFLCSNGLCHNMTRVVDCQYNITGIDCSDIFEIEYFVGCWMANILWLSWTAESDGSGDKEFSDIQERSLSNLCQGPLRIAETSATASLWRGCTSVAGAFVSPSSGLTAVQGATAIPLPTKDDFFLNRIAMTIYPLLTRTHVFE